MLIWLGLVLVLLLLALVGVDLDGLLEALLAAAVLAVLTGLVPSVSPAGQIILFVVLGLLLFAGLRLGRKTHPNRGDSTDDLGTAVVLSAETQPGRYRVRWRGLDGHGSNGRRFEAQPAYGFPAANNQLTMTPAVALASVVASSQALQWQRGARASSDWVSMPSTQAEDHL